jgi:putative PIN family toxin of toxin-antitoxin system
MRALLDANVLISYLLNPAGTSPPVLLVEASFSGSYTLLLTANLIKELREKTATKSYLAARITQNQVERFLTALGVVAEDVPEVTGLLPQVGRDRKDDYLFAHALAGQADYLVSGDNDLLAVGSRNDIKVVSPADFLLILRQADLTSSKT